MAMDSPPGVRGYALSEVEWVNPVRSTMYDDLSSRTQWAPFSCLMSDSRIMIDPHKLKNRTRASAKPMATARAAAAMREGARVVV
jgi:hypothetical protein